MLYVTAVKFVRLIKLRLGHYSMSSRVVSVKFFRRDPMILLLYVWNMFNCLPVADVIVRRRNNFLLKFSQSFNTLCQLCCSAVPIVSVS